MFDIQSLQNSKIIHVKKLLTQRDYRESAQEFVIENEKVIHEIIAKNPQQIAYVLNDGSQVFGDSVSSYTVDPKILRTLNASKKRPQVIAVMKFPSPTTWQPTWETVAVLDQIRDPKNLGAICRAAAAFHIDAIALTPNTADPFHPEAVQAMAGTLFTIPFIQLDELQFGQLLQAGFKPFILKANGKKQIHTFTFPKKSLLVLGSESDGVCTSFLLDSCIEALTIPIHPSVESLNVGVAAGITFYAVHIAKNKE